jgi:ABC-type sugar transport system ATPase subunit
LFLHLSVKDNLTMAMLPQLTKNGVVQKKKQDAIVQQYIDRLSIKTPSSEQLVRYLSGGNQQKVLLARWMCMNPKLIILDEPTRGIDVGAKAEIESLIQEFSAAGISVLMISSEMEELVRNCDRIVVMRDGKKLGELTDEQISMDDIMDTISHGASEILTAKEDERT